MRSHLVHLTPASGGDWIARACGHEARGPGPLSAAAALVHELRRAQDALRDLPTSHVESFK